MFYDHLKLIRSKLQFIGEPIIQKYKPILSCFQSWFNGQTSTWLVMFCFWWEPDVDTGDPNGEGSHNIQQVRGSPVDGSVLHTSVKPEPHLSWSRRPMRRGIRYKNLNFKAIIFNTLLAETEGYQEKLTATVEEGAGTNGGSICNTSRV